MTACVETPGNSFVPDAQKCKLWHLHCVEAGMVGNQESTPLQLNSFLCCWKAFH